VTHPERDRSSTFIVTGFFLYIAIILRVLIDFSGTSLNDQNKNNGEVGKESMGFLKSTVPVFKSKTLIFLPEFYRSYRLNTSKIN